MRKNILKTVIFLFLLLAFRSLYGQTTITMQRESGVYVIPCTVNGLKLKFIFDTGASDVSISLTEALFMIKNNYLNENDIIGTSYAQIANGEITENTRIVLRKVEFASLTLNNVKASVVHQMSAPLLFGQSAIRKLGAFQIDPANNTLVILNGANRMFDYSSSKEEPTTKNAESSFFVHTSVIDKLTSSTEYREFINSINESPHVTEPMDGMKYLQFYNTGIEVLIMKDRINSIYFHHTKVPKFNSYQGQLPKNLTWGMSKAEVYSYLGTPQESGGGGEFYGKPVPYWDKYLFTDFALHITYESNTVDEVVIMTLDF